MSGMFVSYRRSGASTIAYRLTDELQRVFGEKSVFLDVESISPGIPFAQAIQQSLNQCSVVLIVIGPEWIRMADDEGNRRLDNSDDWVRQEVKLALSSDVRVIPVLVQDAIMPTQHELPDDIQELCQLQAFSISNNQTHWAFDVQRLVEKIAEIDKNLGRKIKSHNNSVSYSHKAIWGLSLGLLPAITYFVEGLQDNDEIIGAVTLCLVGIALSFFGLQDIKAGKTKGKLFAIAGMVVCGLLMLISIGELPNHNNSNIEPEAFYQNSDLSSSPGELAVTNIAGLWHSAEGMKYQVQQVKNSVSFTEYNSLGAPIGAGTGVIQGNVYNYNYQSPVRMIRVLI